MKYICFCTNLHENAKKTQKTKTQKTKTQKNATIKKRKRKKNEKRIFSRTEDA